MKSFGLFVRSFVKMHTKQNGPMLCNKYTSTVKLENLQCGNMCIHYENTPVQI